MASGGSAATRLGSCHRRSGRSSIDVPRDLEIASDLRGLKVIDGIPRPPTARKKASGGGFRHCDAGVALALAWAASAELAPLYELTTASDVAPGAGDRWPSSWGTDDVGYGRALP